MIAIGNPWRRDDGAAGAAAALVADCCRTLEVRDLTPELAAEMVGEADVVIVDADVRPGEPEIGEMAAESSPASALLTHSLSPEALVALARVLYGYRGRAWLCSIPGVDFGDGDGLSETAERNVSRAAEMLRLLAVGRFS